VRFACGGVFPFCRAAGVPAARLALDGVLALLRVEAVPRDILSDGLEVVERVAPESFLAEAVFTGFS